MSDKFFDEIFSSCSTASELERLVEKANSKLTRLRQEKQISSAPSLSSGGTTASAPSRRSRPTGGTLTPTSSTSPTASPTPSDVPDRAKERRLTRRNGVKGASHAMPTLSRRNSYDGSDNAEVQKAFLDNLMSVALIKRKGWEGANDDDVKELEELLDGVIANSGDVVEAVSKLRGWRRQSVSSQTTWLFITF